jgi:hypothetical protein
MSSGIRKLRGGRRYYARLRHRAATFSVDLAPGRWYDLWHAHFDWRGHSRAGVRARRAHLDALFTAFRRALVQVADAKIAVQVFVSIAPDRESEQDALYVHTPNPNGTTFPYSFEDVQWGVAPPPILRAYVRDEPWDVGAALGEQAGWWVVRPRGIRPSDVEA